MVCYIFPSGKIGLYILPSGIIGLYILPSGIIGLLYFAIRYNLIPQAPYAITVCLVVAAAVHVAATVVHIPAPGARG